MPVKVAVVDDEQSIRQMIALRLRHHGYEVEDAADGVSGLRLVRTFQPDVIILDVMMPKIDGLELLPQLRRVTEAPIILLSAKGDVKTRVAGLSGGADDYVSKPFDFEELLARIETRLRRTALDQTEILTAHDLEVDLKRQTVTRAGKAIELSAIEYRMLVTFLRNKRHVLSREQLLDLVWGYDSEVGVLTAERYVSYLRAKIDGGFAPKLLRTIRGSGYALDA